jgi:hypothetical protein
MEMHTCCADSFRAIRVISEIRGLLCSDEQERIQKSLLPIIRARRAGVEWEFDKGRRQNVGGSFLPIAIRSLLLIADDNGHSQRNIACAPF